MQPLHVNRPMAINKLSQHQRLNNRIRNPHRSTYFSSPSLPISRLCRHVNTSVRYYQADPKFYEEKLSIPRELWHQRFVHDWSSYNLADPSFYVPNEDFASVLSLNFRFERIIDIWRSFLEEHESNIFKASSLGLSASILPLKTLCHSFEKDRHIVRMFERHIDGLDDLHSCWIYFRNELFLVSEPKSYPIVYPDDRNARDNNDMVWHKELGWEILDHQNPEIEHLFAPIFDYGETWMSEMYESSTCEETSYTSSSSSLQSPSSSFTPAEHYSSSSLPSSSFIGSSIPQSETSSTKRPSTVGYTVFYNIERLRIDIRVLDRSIKRELVISFAPNRRGPPFPYFM